MSKYGFTPENLGYPKTLNRVASELGVGRLKLRAYLREQRVFDPDNNPTSDYQDTGYFSYYETERNNGQYYHSWRVTEMGEELITDMVERDGRDYVQSRNIRIR